MLMIFVDDDHLRSGGALEHSSNAGWVRIGQRGGDFVVIFLSSGVAITTTSFSDAVVCNGLCNVFSPSHNEAFSNYDRQRCRPRGASCVAVLFITQSVATISGSFCVAVVCGYLYKLPKE